MTKRIQQAKELLRSSVDRIVLDELVSEQVALVTQQTSRDLFPHNAAQMDGETVSARIDAYEAAVSELAAIVALIARWGIQDHMPTLARVFTEVGDANDDSSGMQGWVALSWLPFFIIEYAAGIAATSAARYDVLGVIHGALAGKRDHSDEATTAVARGVARMSQAGRDEVFKYHPDFMRRGPRVSNYMSKSVRGVLADVIAFRSEFDVIFDRFEVLDTMLTYSRQTAKRRVHAPPGRFVWKAVNHVSAGDPLTHIAAESLEQGDAWGPTKAGLFSGSAARFLELTAAYRAEYWPHLGW